MKKLFTALTSVSVALCLALSLTACGNSQSTATSAASTASASSASESEPNSIVKATMVESTEDPNTLEEQTLVATVLGASAKNISVMTKDGEIIMFPLVDAETADVDGFDESDWVTIVYKGTIIDDDATSVVVKSVTENAADDVKIAEELTFKDATAATMYTTGAVDLRADYKAGSKDELTIDKGAEVTLTGSADYAWNRIEYEGKTYYFAGEYILGNAPSASLDDEDLVASASDEAAAKAKKNRSTWDAGEVGGVVSGTFDTYYTTVNLRMRAAPSTDAAVLGVAKKGTAVAITDMIGNWSQVYWDGGVAYCDFEYLSETPVTETVVTVAAGIPEGVTAVATDDIYYTTVALHVRAACSTDAAVLGTEPTGTAVHVTAILDNHWSQINYAGTIGYCATQFLSKTAPAPVTINSNSDEVWTIATVYVRANPSLGGKILEAVETGREFARTGITSDYKWSQVDYNGQTAYVASQYLSTSKPSQMNANNEPVWTSVDQTVRTTADLRLHADCSTSAQILVTMPQGVVVNRILTGDNGWSQVIYQGQVGYCASEYLRA